MAGNFDLNDYIQVNERIEKFYQKHPEGSIQTDIVSNQDGQVIIKAYAYRDGEDKHPTTGHAMEKEGSSFINKTSHIENCETSAVGRALAMMGFEIKKSVASREEVENARLNQEQHESNITDAQVKKLFSTANKKGYNAESVKKTAMKKYNVTEIAQLNKTQYDEMYKGYEGLQDK